MDLKKNITKALRISLLPSIEWKTIHEENFTFKSLLFDYAFPLVLLSSIGRTLGMFFSLHLLVPGTFKLVEILSLNFIIWIILPYMLIYMGSLLLNIVLSPFGFEESLMTTSKLIVFTCTPLFIVTFIVFVHPVMRILIPIGVYIFMAYTLYILWYGVRDLLEVKMSQRFLVVAIITVVTFVTLFFIQKLFTLMMASFFSGIEAFFN